MTPYLTFRSGWRNEETGRRINGGRDSGRSGGKKVYLGEGRGEGELTHLEIPEASLYRCCNGKNKHIKGLNSEV